MPVLNVCTSMIVMVIVQDVIHACWFRLVLMMSLENTMMIMMISAVMAAVVSAMMTTMIPSVMSAMMATMMNMMLDMNWYMMMNWLCHKVLVYWGEWLGDNQPSVTMVSIVSTSIAVAMSSCMSGSMSEASIG